MASSDSEGDDGAMPVDRRPVGGRAGDSSDDSDDDDVAVEPPKPTPETLARIAELRAMLQAYPTHYEGHIEYIRLLRSAGLFADLRHAYVKMSEQFPLTGDLWRAWLADEVRQVTSAAGVQRVLELFERAVGDYLCVGVWLDYAAFLVDQQEEHPELISPESIRKVFERAVALAGLHYHEGHALWTAYADFEAEQGDVDKAHAVYQRALRVPMLKVEDVSESYSTWESAMGNADAANHVNRAKESLRRTLKERDARQPLESTLTTAQDYDRLIEFEAKQKPYDPFRLRTVYERAVAAHCLDVGVWSRYISFLENTLKSNDLSVSVHQRAVRNCPWSGDIWSSYMRCLERLGQSPAQIGEAARPAVEATAALPEELIKVQFGIIDAHRRHLNAAADDDTGSARLHAIRKAIHRAQMDVVTYFPGGAGDPLARLERYYARMEFQRGHWGSGREVFDDLLKRIPHSSELWLEYLRLEEAHGRDAEARLALLKRASLARTDDQRRLFAAWIEYEREYGTLDSLALAQTKIATQLALLVQRETTEAAEAAARAQAEAERTAAASRKKGKRNGGADDEDDEGGRKRTRKESASEQPAPVDAKPSPYDDDATRETTVFLSNLPFNVTQERLTKLFEQSGPVVEVRMKVDDAGKFRGFAHVQFRDQSSVARALERDREPVDGRPMFVSKWVNKKHGEQKEYAYAQKNDGRTLYVSDLAKETTEAHLSPLFQKFGTVKSVRLMTKRSGESRQFAYVDFADVLAASNALALNGTIVNGKALKVAISAPPSTEPKPVVPIVPAKPLVPRSVEMRRSRLEVGSKASSAAATSSAAASSSPATSTTMATNTAPAKGKSQADFRKMLGL